MENKYGVDYFIQKFSAIPEDRWITGNYTNQERTKFCAYGFCGVEYAGSSGYRDFSEQESLIEVFSLLGKNASGVAINDGCDANYPQPTPKQRILAALADIKKIVDFSSTDGALQEAKEIIGEQELVNV